MATNLALDDKLIVKVQELGNHRSKKDAVTAALKQYIEHKLQLKIVESFGKVDYEPGTDYKKQRAKK